ncbi:MAG: type II toxin-antitoxin system Phd/YefM family antitoxin [Actinomycetota bacterium]
MRRVNIAQLKDKLSQHLREVERGGEVEVMDRSRPIARIIPVPNLPELRLTPAERPFTELRNRRFPPAHWETTSLELLMLERGSR